MHNKGWAYKEILPNYAPCADLYEMYLANGWQAKENCPDLKPVDASTFGRVIEKVFPNVTKTKRRTERWILLSAILSPEQN